MKNFDTLKQKLSVRRQRGQSLVEMAIIAPVLLLLFIGVFEVGWALRGYLVLSNVNRETVRYAIKNRILSYAVKDPATVGYDKVLSHTIDSLAKQLPLNFTAATANNTMIISHFVIDTALPCAKMSGNKPVVPYEFDPNCNCSSTDPNYWFTRDDLVAYPSAQFPHYLQTYGISRTTQLGNGNFKTYADQLVQENNQLNCTILKSGTSNEISSNNMIVAEAFYNQPQLLGLPIISNRVTDPVPFYTHTAMRIVASRDADTTDTIGPTCEVYPITFHESRVTNAITGTTMIDAFDGGGTGNFGWMNWNPGDNSNGYVSEELANPRLSTKDFTGLTAPPGLDPDPNNTSLNIGDWVSGKTGVGNSEAVDVQLKALTGKTIRVPVYGSGGGTGSGLGYKITHFALVTINQVCLPRYSCAGVSGNDKKIVATFMGYDDDACK